MPSSNRRIEPARVDGERGVHDIGHAAHQRASTATRVALPRSWSRNSSTPGTRHLAALARLIQASLRRFFGFLTACSDSASVRSRRGRDGGTRRVTNRWAAHRHQIDHGRERGVDQAGDAGMMRPIHDEHEESEQQGDGESDAKRLSCGAARVITPRAMFTITNAMTAAMRPTGPFQICARPRSQRQQKPLSKFAAPMAASESCSRAPPAASSGR